MRIPVIVMISIAFSVGCSKPAETTNAPAEPVITESQKIVTQLQSFADKSYPGWQVVAQTQDTYLSGAGEPNYYYTVLTKDGDEKVILAAILTVEQIDGTNRVIIFEPKYSPKLEFNPWNGHGP